MQKVAVFHSPFGSKFGVPRQAGVVPELMGKIVLEKDYRTPDAVRGMEDFDYLWLIWQFSANSHDAKGVTVRPPRLGGNERLGVFATRSPFRPNPIGLSSVRLDHIDYDCDEAPVIYVRGADLMDGTPILDIKPYIPYTDAHSDARGGFTDASKWKPLRVSCSPQMKQQLTELFGEEGKETLLRVLEQDPRPHYHDDPSRTYGMEYGGHDIRFRVVGDEVIPVEVD